MSPREKSALKKSSSGRELSVNVISSSSFCPLQRSKTTSNVPEKTSRPSSVWCLERKWQGETNKCFLCLKPAELRCHWCQNVHFCSAHHFRTYHRVRSKCWPFKVIERGEGKPRVVASRDIRRGELIMEDRPTLLAPLPHSTPVCPCCLARLRDDDVLGNLCEKCSLPLCGRENCFGDRMHAEAECKVIRENKVRVEVKSEQPHFIYSVAIALRMLALKDKAGKSNASARDKEAWDRFNELPDHVQKRRGLGEWNMFQMDVVEFLRKRCFMKSRTEAELHRLISLFIVNSVAVETNGLNKRATTNERRRERKSQGQQPSRLGRAFFPIFSRLRHDCLANAGFSIEEEEEKESLEGPAGFHWAGADPRDEGLVLAVRAKQDIPSGEEITVQYLTSVLGTHKRRKRMSSEWHFDCACPRCSDPTECGTYVSGLACEACEEGVLLPANPLDAYSEWTCDACDYGLGVTEAERKVDEIEDELSELSLRQDLKGLEAFLGRYAKRVLHENHYLLLLAKRNYLYISRRQLIQVITSCAPSDRGALATLTFRKKTELYNDFLWILKRLKCQENF